jgi:hypothetical protein
MSYRPASLCSPAWQSTTLCCRLYPPVRDNELGLWSRFLGIFLRRLAFPTTPAITKNLFSPHARPVVHQNNSAKTLCPFSTNQQKYNICRRLFLKEQRTYNDSFEWRAQTNVFIFCDRNCEAIKKFLAKNILLCNPWKKCHENRTLARWSFSTTSPREQKYVPSPLNESTATALKYEVQIRPVLDPSSAPSK